MCVGWREVSAKLGVPITSVPRTPVPITSSETFSVSVEAPEACPLYAGRVITAIRPCAETPFWMKEQLRRVGIRPVHPVVDVTQYVMWEYGQPLHAFDVTKLAQGIQIRFAKQGETCTLLDGKNVTLSARTLIIADQTGPIALAGVMGGAQPPFQRLPPPYF